MKTILLLCLQFLFFTTGYSQWTYEATLPFNSQHPPIPLQICVVDSTVSWVLGYTGYPTLDYPYFGRKTASGWSYVVNTDLPLNTVAKCITAKDSLTAWLGVSYPEDIYFTSNGGINWVLQYHVSDTAYVQGITFCRDNPNIGYAFADIGRNSFWDGAWIMKTTNGGLNWIKWEFEFYGYHCAENSMSVVDSNHAWFGLGYAPGDQPSKIIMTSTGGANWNIIDADIGFITPGNIQFSNDVQTGVYVSSGSIAKIYRTTNSGFNWSTVYNINSYTSTAMRWVSGTSNIYLVGENRAFRSINNGITWTTMPSGITGTGLNGMDAIKLNANTIYAQLVTTDRRIYKLLDSVRVIGIENIGTTIPNKFSLYQNYPNPFNPSTTIKFDIPKDGNVTIEIYDLLGRVAATLAKNEFKHAGSYKIDWDGSSFSSGVYFYRMTAGEFIDIKKMILVK